MRKLVTVVFVLSLVLLARPADASHWSYVAESTSSMAMCAGNDPGNGAPSCDITTNWGTRVTGQTVGQYCTVSIFCPNGLVKTCQAVHGGGSTPGDDWSIEICYALSVNGGTHKAVCKSDLSWSVLYC